jgi:hypothetical protein
MISLLEDGCNDRKGRSITFAYFAYVRLSSRRSLRVKSFLKTFRRPKAQKNESLVLGEAIPIIRDPV